MTAGGDPTVDVGMDVSINLTDLDAALRKAVTATAGVMSKEFDKIVRTLAAGVKKSASAGQFDLGGKQAQKSVNDLIRSLGQAEAATAGLKNQFGETFDGRVFEGFDDQLRRLIVLQQKLDSGFGNPEAIKQEIKAITSGLVSTRNLAREATASARQDTRVKIQDSRALTSKYVVDAQSQAAAARNASRESVEATKAASRQRVATIQAAARTIATIERGLSTVFRGTANAVGGAFRGIGTAASGVATGIGSAFRRSNNEIINNTSSISNAYSTTFKRTTNTVRNETRQQASVINNFAREAKASISSIGTVGSGAGFGLGAAIGGILGVGAAKALSGGFTRAANLQDAEKALTFLLNSKERAIALQAEILKIVEGTPFALDQFATATTQLLSFGIEAEKIPGFLQAIGDVAILSSSQTTTIDSLVRVFGQISAAGRLTGEDLNQLSEASVPALKILGNTFGVTTGEMRDMVSDGAVPAAEALEALRNGIMNGTDGINGATQAFAGLSKELGTGLRGSLANFNTSLNRLGAGIFTAFEKPFTAALAAATAAVDLLASAIKILATAIQNSLAFQLIQKGLVAMTGALKNAKTELAPFFEFISGGIVVLGQLAAGLFFLKRIPGILGAIGSAIKFILAPQRLLIAGAVLVASYFKELYDESADLRTALGEVGAAIGRIATVIGDLARDAFDVLTGGAKEAGEGVGGIADTVLGVVIPALERLSTFLLEKVLPPIRNFAKMVRTQVLPAVGNFLANAVQIGQDALESLVEFVQDEVVPVVGPILKRAVEIGQNAFEAFYEFMSGTLVPFLKDNLTPILVGVGVALAALTLFGGGIPLAGLAGLAAGLAAVVVLSGNVGKIIDSLKEKLSNLFDSSTLKNIGVGVLKAANKIGEVLGNVLTDRRLLTAVAAVAAAAAVIAAAFVAGLAEGILDNVPDLIDAIGDALKLAFGAAFDAITSDPAIALAVVGTLLGAAAIAKLVVAGRQAGKVLARALAEGAGTTPSAGALGVGGGASGFVSGLLGGPAAIRAAAAKAGTEYAKTMAQTIAKDNALIRAVTGQGLQLDQARGAKGQFTGGAAGSIDNLKKTTAGIASLEAAYGKAAVAGARFQLGLKNIFGASSLAQVRQGLSQIGTAVKSAGKEVAVAAGALAGGAFAASFVSQALFDINASGKDKIQSALGTVAIGAATGQQLGGAKGAAIGAGLGVGVAAVGFLSTAFNDNAKAAQRAKAAVKEYVTAVGSMAGSAFQGGLLSVLRGNTAEASNDIQTDLQRINFSYSEFLAVAQRTSEFEAINSYRRQLESAGVSGDDLNATLGFLREQFIGVEGAVAASSIDQKFMGMEEAVASTAETFGIGGEAAEAFRNKVDELNQARIDGLNARVDEAKAKMGEAEVAADEAKQAVIEMLAGPPVAGTLGEAINNTILDVDALGQVIAGVDPSAIFDPGPLGAEYSKNIDGIKTKIAELLANAPTQADAEALATRLKDGLASQPYGEVVTGLIDEQLTNWDPDVVAISTAAQAAWDAAKTTLETEENALKVGLTIDPLSIPLIAAAAAEEYDKVTADIQAGIAEGMVASPDVLAASAAVGTDMAAATRAALLSNSPSLVYEAIGEDAVAGLQLGLRKGFAPIALTAKYLGIATMQGLEQGIKQGGASAIAAARAIALQVAQAIRDALKIKSPSQVTEEIGEQTVEGFIVGIDKSLPLVEQIAFSTATEVAGAFKAIGTKAARAIGLGFAQEGVGFANSVAGALDEALETAMDKVDQFKVIGKEIASAMFASQGSSPLGVVGGGPSAVDLERAFISILGNAGEFQAAVAKQVEEVIGKTAAGDDIIRGLAGFSTDISSSVGQANRSAFLEAGLDVREYGAALLEGGRTVESAVWEMQVYRDQIIGLAQSFAFPAETIDEMIRTLGLADDQLNQFVSTTRATEAAAAAAAAEAAAAIANQLAAEQAAEAAKAAEEAREVAADAAQKAWDEAADAAEKAAEAVKEAAREAEERTRREYTLAQPLFRDLVVQSPSGDPEAVALAAANRVAYAVRR